MRDPYSVLGVRRNAGPDEIKTAWRTVAKSIHPDQNRDDPTATARFAEAGRAYEVLKDPKLRNRYDQARREADLRRMEEMARKSRADEPREDTVDPETAEEMISRLFGADGKARSPEQKTPPPSQPQAQAQAPSPVQPQAAKPEAPKAEAKPEAVADGKPEQKAEPRADATPERPAFGGFPRAAAPAAELVSAIVRRIRGGAQKPVPDKVPDIFCDVTVSIREIFRRDKALATLPDGQTLKVALPPGTTHGTVIRLKEQGYRLNGLLRGDLVVHVHVPQDGPFRTDGLDLRTTLPISLQDAVLGGEASVETLTGPLSVTVPAWSGSETVITVPGHGLLRDDGKRADLLVELRLMLREKPDEKLIDLMLSRRNGLFL